MNSINCLNMLCCCEIYCVHAENDSAEACNYPGVSP